MNILLITALIKFIPVNVSATGVTDSMLEHCPSITHLGQVNYYEGPEKLFHCKTQW